MRRSHSAPKSERKSNQVNEEDDDRPTAGLFNYNAHNPAGQGGPLMIDPAQMQILGQGRKLAHV